MVQTRKTQLLIMFYTIKTEIFYCRYQSGDQTPASEVGGPTTGGAMAPPADLDVKTQILQQQELQKQASAAAKTKGNSAPTSPMKDGKKASFFGKVILVLTTSENELKSMK